MKAIIPILFALALFSKADEKSLNLLHSKVRIHAEAVNLSEIFEHLSDDLKTPPNIVFKGDAGDHMISSLKVKDVTLENLFEVLETIADVEIKIVEKSKKAPVGNDPFASEPSSNPGQLTSAGIVVISSTRPERTFDDPRQAQLPKIEEVIIPISLVTEVIPLTGLKLPADAEGGLIEIIQKTWEDVNQKLVFQSRIAFHKEAQLLIVTAPAEAIETAQKIAGALLPDYEKQVQARKQSMLGKSVATDLDLPGTIRPVPATIQTNNSGNPNGTSVPSKKTSIFGETSVPEPIPLPKIKETFRR